MLRDYAALTYLEARSLVNWFRTLVREPKRLIAWSLYAVLIGNAWLQRSMQRQFSTLTGTNQSWLASAEPAIYAVLPGIVLALLGSGVLTSALRRRPKIGFTYPADGRFLCGSKISQRAVVAWMQLRTMSGLAVRLPILIFVIAGLPGIAQMPIGTMLVGGFAILSALLLNWQAANAAAILSRRLPVLWIIVGGALLAGGLGALAVPLVFAVREPARLLSTIAAHGISMPPGSWLVAALEGHWAYIVPLTLLALAAGTAATWASGDCYPEMWQASSRLFVLRRLLRRGSYWHSVGAAVEPAGSSQARRRPAVSAVDSVLAGPWTILWKDWISFVRAPVSAWGPAVRVILIIVVTIGIGVAFTAGDVGESVGRAALIAIGASGFFWYVQILALMSGAIAIDLRMPLWSLSAARMPMRLFAWTIAAAWRPAIASALILGALGIAGRVPLVTALALPATVLVTWATRVVGLAAFTILPHQGDIRGPAAMLRVLMIYLLMAPAAVTAVIAQVLGGLAAAATAGATVLIAECIALLLFAATRLEGNAIAYCPTGTAETP